MNCLCWRGLTVDIIRRMWDRGIMRDNKWLNMCHDNWFDYWVDYRTCVTMTDVDRQAAELNPEPVKMEEPTFTETLEGETPLGGEMRLSHDFYTPDHDA